MGAKNTTIKEEPGVMTNNTTWEIKEEDLKILVDCKLGEGSYGVVYKARWRRMNVAAKKLHDIFFEGSDEGIRALSREFREEWELLSTLQHSNILKMFGVVIPSRPGKSPVMVTELLDCSLLQFYKRSTSVPKISDQLISSIMLDVAQGLKYLHDRENPIAHRDLASKNILLTQTPRTAKIADLGVARVFRDYMQQYATPGPGTPVYQAPETLVVNCSNQARYSPKVDIFSYGVILMEVILGKEPKPSLKRQGQTVPELERRQVELSEVQNTNPLRGTVLDCLRDEPVERPSAEQLVHQLEKIQTKIKGTKTSFKVVLVGPNAVGKSCLLQRYKEGYFNDVVRVTVGAAFALFTVQLDGESVQLHVCDTAAGKIFREIMPSYIRNASAFVLVYDVTEEQSFLNMDHYKRLFVESGNQDALSLLVGNKADLEDHRMVSEESAREYARQNDMRWMETSAKTGKNVDHLFLLVARLLKERADFNPQSASAASSTTS